MTPWSETWAESWMHAGLELSEYLPEGLTNTVAGAVGAIGIMGFALKHVLGRRRLSLAS